MDEWIFGYGSLIWRADFPFAERRPARINGFVRRFWQGSTDHRGVPGAPGRVVTLIESPAASCWGIAYKISPRDAEDVMAHLDYREKGGYVRRHIDVHFADAAREALSAPGLVYHATESNPNFLGEAAATDIALQIHRSIGPSGHNREYLLELEAALRDHEVEDEHVYAIADALRRLD